MAQITSSTTTQPLLDSALLVCEELAHFGAQFLERSRLFGSVLLEATLRVSLLLLAANTRLLEQACAFVHESRDGLVEASDGFIHANERWVEMALARSLG